MVTRVSGSPLPADAGAPLLFSLAGAPLTGVEFFGNGGRHVLLRFGAARLEVLSKAVVRADAGEPSEEAYPLQDALQSCLSSRLSHIALEPGRELVLTFDNGTSLAVSLRAEDRSGPESAVVFDEQWQYEPF